MSLSPVKLAQSLEIPRRLVGPAKMLTLAGLALGTACSGPANLREYIDSEGQEYTVACRKAAGEHELAVNDLSYLRPQLHARVWPLTLRPDSDRMVSEQVFFDALREGKLKFVLLQARGGIGKSELGKALTAESCAQPAFLVNLAELYGAEALAGGANLIVEAVAKQMKVRDGMQRDSFEQVLVTSRWLLVADSLDEVPNSRRQSVLDAIQELRKRYPAVQVVVSGRPSVFDDYYGIKDFDAVLELPPLDCGRARSSLTRMTDSKDDATRVSNFAHDWRLDRQSTLDQQCYFPYMATYRDLQAVQRLAKDFASDERLTNMSIVHEAILSERLQKELQELQWSGDRALAAVDALVATDGVVKSEGDDAPHWDLLLTLPRCLKAQGGDTPETHNICERLFQSVLFERIQGAREWKFGHQAAADLFVARWVEAQLAKTPGRCDAVDAPTSLLADKEHRDVATYLVSRPNGSRCLASVIRTLCTSNGGPNGLAQQLSRGLPPGNARYDTISLAKDQESARGEKPEACVNQVLGQLRK
jgi:hypothetical protein